MKADDDEDLLMETLKDLSCKNKENQSKAEPDHLCNL